MGWWRVLSWSHGWLPSLAGALGGAAPPSLVDASSTSLTGVEKAALVLDFDTDGLLYSGVVVWAGALLVVLIGAAVARARQRLRTRALLRVLVTLHTLAAPGMGAAALVHVRLMSRGDQSALDIVLVTAVVLYVVAYVAVLGSLLRKQEAPAQTVAGSSLCRDLRPAHARFAVFKV